MASILNDAVLDALIIGAGFGGVYQLKHVHDTGYKVKFVDPASDYGGVCQRRNPTSGAKGLQL
ncbi:unnamed protein product [Clonostachys rosea]|uniref:FAD/NAD(P)-binding domain-containing protein n=1 Tax=Bionectria ochroleuca TaxID=29856 RepID=A0ABY6UGA8_BIOOC|nr:unnamed protein product [Clonostachys rosea]